jgi:hypothetical protein
MYTPNHLEKWVEYVNYTGDNFDEYYIASWRFFRCSPVERSNFAYIKDHLKGCFTVPSAAEEQGLLIFPTFTDEVMSCRYYILIHKSQDKALRMADMFAERIERKGSLDPEQEIEMDRKASRLTWNKSRLVSRYRYCKDAGVSIFAARRTIFPDNEPALAEKLYGYLSELT